MNIYIPIADLKLLRLLYRLSDFYKRVVIAGVITGMISDVSSRNRLLRLSAAAFETRFISCVDVEAETFAIWSEKHL